MKVKNSHYSVQMITSTALMAAIIFVVTYVIRIPLPFASGGYLNIGDTPIYIGAYLLGGPAGAIAGALGSALADLAAGYVFYAIPTAIIKGLMGLVPGLLMARSKSIQRFLFASIIGGAIMVAGYAIFEAFFFNINQAIATIPFNAIQWGGGVVVAVVLFPAIRRIKQAIPALGQEPQKKDL